MSAPITACWCGDVASCDTCYQREYKRRVYRLRAYGQWEPKGDIEAVVEHVRWLKSQKVGHPSISRAANIAPSTLTRITSGRSKWVSRDVAERILAVTPEAGVRVPAIGASRRLCALSAIGHSTRWMADQLGINQNNVREIMVDCSFVMRETFERIEALYERYSMRPGTSIRSRQAAARNGWPPPLAWDDIDDPDEQPHLPGGEERSHDDIDHAVVERLLAGERIPSTRAEKDEAMRRWRARGRSERELCLMHGWHDGRYGRGAA